MIGIYKITSPSGKIYIGQSNSIEIRKQNYAKIKADVKRQPKIYNSLIKYGWEAHTFEVVEECVNEELNIRERYWQEYFEVVEKGLNCVLVNTDTQPLVRSLETRRKTSEAKIGEKNGMFGRTGDLHPNFGKVRSKEWCDRIREGRKGVGCKKVIDTSTGIIYNSIKDAAEFLGIDKVMLGCYLIGKYTNKTTMQLLKTTKQ